MSKSPSPRATRLRSSEDKLYEACLDACIQGIKNLPVSKRRPKSATVRQKHNNAVTATSPLTHTHSSSKPERTTTPPPETVSAASLISPPPTPQHKGDVDATMNCAPLHGAPTWGQAPSRGGLARGSQPAYGSKDSRGSPQPAFGNQRNFAVQPAVNSSNVRLKKATVKIVSAAPGTPSRATPAASPIPVPGPVKAKPKEPEHREPVKPATPVAAPTSVSIKVESPTSNNTEESALDDLFARLSSSNLSKSSSSAKQGSPERPKSKTFSFEERLSPPSTPTKALDSFSANLSAPPVKPAESLPDTPVVSQGNINIQQAGNTAPTATEQLYLEKAAGYLDALPPDSVVAVQIIKAVSTKLRDAFAHTASLNADDAEKIKARYAFAILNYINKAKAKAITSESAKQIVRDSDGKLLRIYAKLVDEEYLSLADMSGVTGLNKVILDVLPKVELNKAPVTLKVDLTAAPIKTEAKSVTTVHVAKTEDPMNGLKAWPVQEKRETPPAYRACILKGVSGITSINQLQALVWGGRLESIAMPAPGSDFAVVRFLTPEACDKYFKATGNGIEVKGEKKTVVFVEKQPGPTSINDVMRNCTEGDASRCVRALDAEEDWSDMVLMKLARGKGVNKREVDRIKQGKNARGRHYIEFRFANIYHALNFKRQLHENQDWEPCTISYATDPCETAQGVHYKDADEEDAAIFA